MAHFEIKHRDGLARLGEFHTAHGIVETPTLLPVINPNLVVITPNEMREEFGVQMVITNSYIIKKSEHLREKALSEGLHALLDFDGPIMTDSGTFQSYVYGDVDVSPQEIVAFQRDIGTDVGTILDIFTEPKFTREQATAAVKETVIRAKDATNYAGDMGLALPVQGGIFPDLREKCAKEMSGLKAAVHPVGGVVPLMEDYRYAEVIKAVIHAKKGLRHNIPVHLFGCGHPMLFPLAVLAGCDLFDSASYIKYARDGRLLFPWGTKHLEDMSGLPCDCKTCRENSVKDLLGMEARQRHRALAYHNLAVSFSELRRVRQSILEGRIWELACERTRSHPRLLEVLAILKRHSPWIEQFTPSSRPRGMLYTGLETLWRPEAYHVIDRLFAPELYDRQEYMLVPLMGGGSVEWALENREKLISVASATGKGILVDTIFGPVPLELMESYPFGGMIMPTVPQDLEESFYPTVEGRRTRLLSKLIKMDKRIEAWDEELIEDWERPDNWESILIPFEERRMRMISDYQFFPDAWKILLPRELKLIRSKNTGKVRNIIEDGEHVLSLRAEDNMFTLKLPGARRLAEKGRGSHVVVDSDSGTFNRQGKNVMSKFVITANDDINPRDEVYVLDDNDTLLAVGKAILTAVEMKDFTRGVAVRVKEGVGAPDTS